jgi:adenylate cyclase
VEIQPSPEIEAVFKRMWKAFVAQTEKPLFNIVSDDPSVRMILASDDQWYSGGATVASVLAQRSRILGLQRAEFDRIEAFEAGDFGWAAAELTTTIGDNEPIVFRNTASFVLDDGIWRLVQIHTSVGVPQADVVGVEVDENLLALVDSLGERNTTDIEAVAGSTGTVTLMFTDIEDSTVLSQLRGDDRWTREIQEHLSAVEAVVVGCGGRVVKTLGDGSMAAFPSVKGAAEAALRIQQIEAADDFRVRIGIHTGEAVTIEDDYSGVAVAKAARVASAAAGGETLISSTTMELLDRFDYETGAERVVELKGLNGTHRLFPLIASGS